MLKIDVYCAKILFSLLVLNIESESLKMSKDSNNILKNIFFPSENVVEKVYKKFDVLINKLLKGESALKKVLSPAVCLYLIVGVFTTVINLGVYYGLYFVLQSPPDTSFLIQIINFIAWLVAVIACFFPNKFYVFRSKFQGGKHTWKEFVSFICSRIATLLLETVGIYVFCTLLNLSAVIIKPVLAVLVVIFNYVLGKILVFGKGMGK